MIERGPKSPFIDQTTKQDPGVQDGERGFALCAGDAIADPWPLLVETALV